MYTYRSDEMTYKKVLKYLHYSEFSSDTSAEKDQLKQYKAWVSNERWNELKKIAEAAMKDRKVFMIKGGGFPAIRRALLERGWVEKYESHKVPTSDISNTLIL